MKVASITTIPTALITFIRQARDELKKVSWPSRETTIRYTIIVVASSLAAGVIIGAVDYLLALLLGKII